MPKNKTHSGAKKRFQVTGTGKVMREQANNRHLLEQQVRARAPARLSIDDRDLSGRRQEGQAPARQLSPPPAHSPRPSGQQPRLRIPKENTHGTRQAGSQRPQEAPRDPRAGQRLPRPAVPAVPQGQGAGPPLDGLRLPRPQGAQGRLPPAVDPADQRRGPRERHDLQPVHPGPQGRRRRGRPQGARRPRRQRRRRRSPRWSSVAKAALPADRRRRRQATRPPPDDRDAPGGAIPPTRGRS